MSRKNRKRKRREKQKSRKAVSSFVRFIFDHEKKIALILEIIICITVLIKILVLSYNQSQMTKAVFSSIRQNTLALDSFYQFQTQSDGVKYLSSVKKSLIEATEILTTQMGETIPSCYFKSAVVPSTEVGGQPIHVQNAKVTVSYLSPAGKLHDFDIANEMRTIEGRKCRNTEVKKSLLDDFYFHLRYSYYAELILGIGALLLIILKLGHIYFQKKYQLIKN